MLTPPVVFAMVHILLLALDKPRKVAWLGIVLPGDPIPPALVAPQRHGSVVKLPHPGQMGGIILILLVISAIVQILVLVLG